MVLGVTIVVVELPLDAPGMTDESKLVELGGGGSCLDQAFFALGDGAREDGVNPMGVHAAVSSLLVLDCCLSVSLRVPAMASKREFMEEAGGSSFDQGRLVLGTGASLVVAK